MDKNAIKKYAVWARRELIERVSQKALQYAVTADGKADPDADSVNGRLLSDVEKKQRKALIRKVSEIGYEQVMEEAAYIWFNRFAALRFMEVNGYLPSHVRVFTNDDGEFGPQILTEAIHLDIDGLDMDKVYELKDANKEEELYKYLLIVQCNALYKILPGMFQKIEDFTELLLPDYLLREGSVIERMVVMIPESDWLDQVQIIGWLYQYYNTEPKDKVFADLKKNIKITKENIPAATQLFTPDWIVRYMVENSLGRLWVEGHPDSKSQFLPDKEEREAYASGDRENQDGKWHYYLEEAPQEPEVETQLAEIRKEYAALTPEEILCVDPCAGSGHILCCQFDVLFAIYQSCGYTAREAVANIIKKNLWGLDIDERAAQLAYFAVMMKARQYDRRFLSRKDEDGKPDIPQPHVYAIAQSNGIDKDALEYFCVGRRELTAAMEMIVSELHDAKEYGSILTVTEQDWGLLTARVEEVEQDISIYKNAVTEQIKPLVQTARTLAQKYHAVVTNPPYMGSSGQCAVLSEYVKKHYPDSKSDLFAVFMERCGEFTRKNGYQAMITQHSWMFLSSFEKLRQKLLLEDTVNMAHLGARAFEEIGGEVVQTTSFAVRKSHIQDYQGVYCRLIEPTTQNGKEEMFLSGANRYTTKQSNFSKIPGSPVAYWVGEKFIQTFENPMNIDKISDFTGSQNITSDNEKFLRFFWEIENQKIGINKGWAYYAKGGEYRKWYGNILLVVDVSPLAKAFYKTNKTSNLLDEKYWFSEGITYSAVTSKGTGFRYYPPIGGFDKGGATLCFVKNLQYILALLNSKYAKLLFEIINPTLNLQVKDVKSLPVILPTDHSTLTTINSLVEQNISLSKADWDSFETSWDFQRHPLVVGSGQWAVDSKEDSNHYSQTTNDCSNH